LKIVTDFIPYTYSFFSIALPVVPVVISVGVRHDSYGVTNAEGNLTLLVNLKPFSSF